MRLWYHGTPEPWSEADPRPLYVTGSRALASWHATGRHGRIYAFKIDDDARWLDISESDICRATMDSIGYDDAAWDALLAEGIQVVWDRDDYRRGFDQLFILDPSVLTLVAEESR